MLFRAEDACLPSVVPFCNKGAQQLRSRSALWRVAASPSCPDTRQCKNHQCWSVLSSSLFPSGSRESPRLEPVWGLIPKCSGAAAVRLSQSGQVSCSPATGQLRPLWTQQTLCLLCCTHVEDTTHATCTLQPHPEKWSSLLQRKKTPIRTMMHLREHTKIVLRLQNML